MSKPSGRQPAGSIKPFDVPFNTDIYATMLVCWTLTLHNLMVLSLVDSSIRLPQEVLHHLT